MAFSSSTYRIPLSQQQQLYPFLNTHVAADPDYTDHDDYDSTFSSTMETFLMAITDTTTSRTQDIFYNLDYYPEMDELIHNHWRRFPPVNYIWHLVMGAVILGLGVVALSGNAAVAYIFSQTKGLRNPSNALIVNLAVSDFAMMISNCPMYFMNSLRGKWMFGVQACKFYGFCGALFGTVSILTMAAIAMDRYLVICKPFLIMKSAMTRERAKFAMVFVWIYSLVWAIIPLCGISNYVLEGFLTTCTFDYLDPSDESRIFIFAMFIGAYVAPLLIIILCYLFIIWEVYRHAKKFKKAASNMKVGAHKANTEQKKQKKEVKTAKIAAVIIACWTFAWTPYAAVALLGIATDGSLLTPIASQLPALFAKTAAVYNPIVYAISHPKYREALRHRFPLLGYCIKASDEEKESSTSQAPPTGRGNSKPRAQRQISTTSQSNDSQLSDVEEIDNTATPQTKRKVTSSSSGRQRGGASVGPIRTIESPHAALKREMVDVPQHQMMMKEIVAQYSRSNLPENVTFTQTRTLQSVPSEEVWHPQTTEPLDKVPIDKDYESNRPTNLPVLPTNTDRDLPITSQSAEITTINTPAAAATELSGIVVPKVHVDVVLSQFDEIELSALNHNEKVTTV